MRAAVPPVRAAVVGHHGTAPAPLRAAPAAPPHPQPPEHAARASRVSTPTAAVSAIPPNVILRCWQPFRLIYYSTLH